MARVLLGIDIGTSACKAVAFSLDGQVQKQASVSYPVYYPQEGFAEQEPDDWWNAVVMAIQSLLRQGIRPEWICGIGVDGQSGSAVAVDRSGQALCRTPIWMDTRTSGQCAWMNAQVGAERIFSVSGNSVHPMYTMPKVLWYREKRPEIYEQTDCILQSNGYIVFRLTGSYSQDHSQGYGWSCYRIAERSWDLDLCRGLGVRTDLLPPLFECYQVVGGISEMAARETGLLAGTPVVAGGLDAACAALGAGVTEPGQTQEQGGQAGGMSICMEQAFSDPMLILSPHVIPERWLLQGGTVGGGAAVNWYVREFGAEERSQAAQNKTNVFAELDKRAAQVNAGSDGLIFLPYLAGERSPVWNPHARGVFYGIDFAKTKAHFSRAVMEGVAYSLLHNLKVAESAGASVDVLRAVGGAANSPFWMQMKSDVTGKVIEVPSSDTATALGAAILAGFGVGVYPDVRQALKTAVTIQKSYEPDLRLRDIYEDGYRTYCELYEELKVMMNEGAREHESGCVAWK